VESGLSASVRKWCKADAAQHQTTTAMIGPTSRKGETNATIPAGQPRFEMVKPLIREIPDVRPLWQSSTRDMETLSVPGEHVAKSSATLDSLTTEIEAALSTCDQLGASIIACHLQLARDLVAEASACFSAASISSKPSTSGC